MWYIVHSVVYTCDLILARIWLLGLCPFINRVLHYHIEMGTYILIDLLGAGGSIAAAQLTSADAP